MSNIPLPRVLSTRGKNTLEVERERFEHQQNTGIQKAINMQETAVKEKHLRTAVIGTHKEKSALLFWGNATKLPLQGNPIVCWKFCHVLHKLLREGHPQSVPDSLKYCMFLKDLGKLWGHLRDGYGRLIAFYTKLLYTKLLFHKKIPSIPGNLLITDEQLEQICGNDVNSFFEVSVDMLDYMDDLLALETQVFNSMDMARSNSMTNSGQCRLAPLILVILDSCQIYDYIVKILFKLHSALPPDTLHGHRDRFLKQYHRLKKFYEQSSNLQYFKNLIRVPVLSEYPPDFLVASSLESHVKPEAVVPEVVPEPEVATDLLIDTSSDHVHEPQPQASNYLYNGSPSPPPPDERDMMIESLMSELTPLKSEITRLKGENSVIAESLNNKIRELEFELNEMKRIAEQTTEENETLKNTFTTLSADAEQNRNEQLQQLANVNAEKYSKIKDIYGKLREEHVCLLRKNAEAAKKYSEESRKREEAVMELQSVQQQLNEANVSKSLLEASLVTSNTAQIDAIESEQKRLEHEKDDLSQRLEVMTLSNQQLENNVESNMAARKNLEEQLSKIKSDFLNSEYERNNAKSDIFRQFIVSACTSGAKVVKNGQNMALISKNDSDVSCSAENLRQKAKIVSEALEAISEIENKYRASPNTASVVSEMVDKIYALSYAVSNLVQYGADAAQISTVAEAAVLRQRCGQTGDITVQILESLRNSENVAESITNAKKTTEEILASISKLFPNVEDVRAEELSDLVDDEMAQTSQSIEMAANRIAEMLSAARAKDSGLKLEVNERILDSCNNLMLMIKILVEKSKSLQREIVAQGRGAGPAKDYYKRNHRWTEGLISAAKAVGLGANLLVDGADKVVQGKGSFEQLMVCAHEITSSTTQLVVSSKVKAAKESRALQELSFASRGVTDATSQVVASARSGATLMDDLDTLDYNNLTLHQAKRLEMESQVKVLELESDLVKERQRLGELRKKHYRLAGETEGWDESDIELATGGSQSEA